MKINNKCINVACLCIGAAAGSVITWALMKQKCAEQIKKESQETRDLYWKKYHKSDEREKNEETDVKKNENIEEDLEEKKASYRAYKKEAAEYGTPGYSDGKKNIDEPYVIPPLEYGEFEGYRQIELVLYADGIIAEDSEPLEEDEVDRIIGSDALNHFGDYEEDAVYIRNDALQCDYALIRDDREFGDVLNSRGYPR